MRYPGSYDLVAHLATQKIAEAREKIGDIPRAIEVLEAIVQKRPGPTRNSHHMWIASSAQLARLYRQKRQDREARAIETRLLKLLAFADADHPLVMELKARQQ